MTKLDDRESIYLALGLELTVIVIRYHCLHGITLVTRSCATSRERSLVSTIRINKVGSIIFGYIHHAERPLLGKPVGVLKMT